MDNEKDKIKQLFMDTKAYNFDTFNNQWDNEARAIGFFKPAYPKSVKDDINKKNQEEFYEERAIAEVEMWYAKDTPEYEQRVKELKLRRNDMSAMEFIKQMLNEPMYAGTSHTKFDLTFTEDMFDNYNSNRKDYEKGLDKPLNFSGGGILEAIKDTSDTYKPLTTKEMYGSITDASKAPMMMGRQSLELYNAFWSEQHRQWLKDGLIVVDNPIEHLSKKLNVEFNTAKHIYIVEFLKGVQYEGLHKIDRYKTLISNIRSAIFEDKFDPSILINKHRAVKLVSTGDAILALMGHYKIVDMTYSYKDFVAINIKQGTNIKSVKKRRPIKYAKP